MRRAGYAIFGVGMLVGCFFLVEVPDAVDWSRFGPALAVALLGIGIARLGGSAAEPGEELMDIGRLREALRSLIAAIEVRPLETSELPGYIDDTLMPHVAVFVEGRETIQRAFGIDAYASVMDRFARAERAMNRAWAASADGYGAEAHRALEAAGRGFSYAQDIMAELSADAPAPDALRVRA